MRTAGQLIITFILSCVTVSLAMHEYIINVEDVDELHEYFRNFSGLSNSDNDRKVKFQIYFNDFWILNKSIDLNLDPTLEDRIMI